MDRTERFYRIRRRLVEKGALTRRQIEEDLEISHSTCKRDIEYMRDRLNVPIIWSAERQAYVLDPDADVAELPGVWFSPGEVYALLDIEHLLEQLEPGLLSRQLGPVRERLSRLLEGSERGHREIRRRIKVLPMGTRRVNREVFETPPARPHVATSTAHRGGASRALRPTRLRRADARRSRARPGSCRPRQGPCRSGTA